MWPVVGPVPSGHHVSMYIDMVPPLVTGPIHYNIHHPGLMIVLDTTLHITLLYIRYHLNNTIIEIHTLSLLLNQEGS